jgi:arylsulfatase A-like enzyme
VADNILILLGDDIGVDNVGVYQKGTDLPATPRFDALANAGVRFNNAWANPQCTQTRATIETGRYAIHNGMGQSLINERIGSFRYPSVTIPKLLDRGTGHAYEHAFFGKWHLDVDRGGWPWAPNMHGWRFFQGQKGNLDQFGETFYAHTKVTQGRESFSTKYQTEETADDAIAWIAKAKEPWLAYVSFNAAHSPYHTPPPGTFTTSLAGLPPVPGALPPRPYYKAAIEAFDFHLGRVIDSLGPKLGHTLIILGTDNGTPVEVLGPGIPPTQAKSLPTQGGVLVPFVLVRQGGPPGTSDALVNSADIYATIAEIAGADLAKTGGPPLDSVSLLPYLSNPKLPSIREFQYAERFQANNELAPGTFHIQTVREKRYKLIRGLPGIGDILFDLDPTGPGETFNLLDLPAPPPEALAAYVKLQAFLAGL